MLEGVLVGLNDLEVGPAVAVAVEHADAGAPAGRDQGRVAVAAA